MSFVHLHLHSHYSLLDGLGKIDDILAKVKEHKMTACALTDHGCMYGVVEFYQKAKDLGIKPIVGMETYIAPNRMYNKRAKIDTNPFHLTLLVKNKEGYLNLLKISSAAQLEGFYYKPRIDKEFLAKHTRGLIALSGCVAGEVPSLLSNGHYEQAKKAALKYQEMFGKGNFYLEVQYIPTLQKQVRSNEGMKKLSKELDIPLVATNDTHYVNKEDNKVHDVLLCVQTGRKVHEENRMKMINEDYSMRPPEQMEKDFKDFPGAVENTVKIAEKCNFEMELGKILLPEFPLPKGETADGHLRNLSLEGLKYRYGYKDLKEVDPEYMKRLDYELDIIKQTGYAAYFLIVQDFITWAKDQGILVGPGRGSAAGSFVSYLTRITDMDPIKYNLLFERFLNPERISMPDIDTDFADHRRDEVIQYVASKYGRDHVAQIITFGTMAARAALRDAGRALGFPYDFCDKMAKLIPMFTSLKDALEQVKELKELYNSDPQAKKLLDYASKLEGVARHASVHACGVVITPKPLTEYTPLQKASQDDDSVITQYSLNPLDEIGILKMDFLGLKNLTIIQNAIEIIEKARDVKIDIHDIPLDDETTYKIFQEGKTTGIFQLESAGMKRYLKQLLPTVFEDIISMVALYRPGPMDSIPDFIDGKHGRRKITYLHPKLEPILKSTYGIIVTQEQVLQIARSLGGFTYGQADVLRKAVGKKIKKLLDEQKKKLIDGMVKNDIKKETAEKIWNFIEPFARYGFNRAHAACYAMIGYQTAYLKAHYPAEFMAALMTSDQGNADRIAIEVSEASAMKIKILPPDINESFRDFTVVHLFENGDTLLLKEFREKYPNKKPNPAIRFGLGAIKNVGEGIIKAVTKERKANGRFSDLDNFITRINSKDFNKKSIESLVKAGALEKMGERNQLLHNLQSILEYAKVSHKAKSGGQVDLFGGSTSSSGPKLKLEVAEVADNKTKLSWEKQYLGLYVSAHPLTTYKDFLEEYALKISEITTNHDKKGVRVSGIVTRLKQITTKKGQPMAFAQIEDLSSTIEVVVFPSVFEKTKEHWREDNMIIVEGKISVKDGMPNILADNTRELNEELMHKFERYRKAQKIYSTNVHTEYIYIKVPEKCPPKLLEEIKSSLKSAKSGVHKVALLIPKGENKFSKIETNFRVDKTFSLTKNLEGIVGEGNVT